MKVLVLGARGMLADDVIGAASRRGHEVRGFGHTDLDITDPRSIAPPSPSSTARTPSINCAAWTDVDGAEDDPRRRDGGQRHRRRRCRRRRRAVGAKIIYVSSDYVFDGDKGDDYVETDQTGPISVYGRSKLAGETSVADRQRAPLHRPLLVAVRARGPNFVNTMIRLGEPGPGARRPRPARLTDLHWHLA